MATRTEHRSLRAAADERKAAALAMRHGAADDALIRQLEVAIRLFDDVNTLFLAKVNPGAPQPNDELWLMAADAYFRAACVFFDGLQVESGRIPRP